MVPEHPAGTAAWNLVLAVIGHWGIYLLMLIASILGWTLAGTFGTPQDAQLFGFIPVPAIASNANSRYTANLENYTLSRYRLWRAWL